MKKHLIIICASLIILCLAITKLTFSCVPNLGDNWFLTDVNVDKNSLPGDVQFIKNPKEYELGFFNPGTTPFYLIYKDWDQVHAPKPRPDFKKVDTELPDGIIPKSKIVLGERYAWNGVNYPGFWQKVDFGYETEANHITGERLFDFGIETIREGGVDRPKNVTVPEPQEFKFLAYYGSEPVEIKGVIYYRLNEDFKPNRGGGCGATIRTNGIYYLHKFMPESVIIVFLILILFIPAITYLLVRKRIEGKKQKIIIVFMAILLTVAIFYLLFAISFNGDITIQIP